MSRENTHIQVLLPEIWTTESASKQRNSGTFWMKDICTFFAVNALANQCGVAPSTIYGMLNAKSKNPGVVPIQKICDGLDISVRDFFDDPVFENLEPIIK